MIRLGLGARDRDTPKLHMELREERSFLPTYVHVPLLRIFQTHISGISSILPILYLNHQWACSKMSCQVLKTQCLT